MARDLWDKLIIVLQYILPQHLLSSWMYSITRSRWRPLKNLLISHVVRRYHVDMEIAAEQDYRAYNNFNQFFTRKLKPGTRLISEEAGRIISPIDGSISQIGIIDSDEILQAKGHTYNLGTLLGEDKGARDSFRNGNFATLYLSPRDYHRVHMPADGRLLRMIYVPGRLFSVSRSTTLHVPELFSRNERVISIFQTGIGIMAVILVGAIFVGSMETVWAGQITPMKPRLITRWNYQDKSEVIELQKGDELGRFNMGSTVIILFEHGRIEWLPELQADDQVVMGQAIAKISNKL